jgi:hypothetical protein
VSGHRFLPLALPSVELGCRLRRPGRDSIPGIEAPSHVSQPWSGHDVALGVGNELVAVSDGGRRARLGQTGRGVRVYGWFLPVGHGGGGVCVCVCVCVWCALASVRLRVCGTCGCSVSRALDR